MSPNRVTHHRVDGPLAHVKALVRQGHHVNHRVLGDGTHEVTIARGLVPEEPDACAERGRGGTEEDAWRDALGAHFGGPVRPINLNTKKEKKIDMFTYGPKGEGPSGSVDA